MGHIIFTLDTPKLMLIVDIGVIGGGGAKITCAPIVMYHIKMFCMYCYVVTTQETTQEKTRRNILSMQDTMQNNQRYYKLENF